MRTEEIMSVLRTIALVLIIVGALNWGLVGLFQFDLVAALFGGQDAMLARVVYVLVGLAGVAALIIFPVVMHRRDTVHHHHDTHATTH
jgi:uncharacterized membrane protein YuzA (DUF378 family)